MGNNTVDGVKKAVEQGAVSQKEITEIFINGEDTVAVMDVNELKGHTGSAFHGVFVSTSGAKTAVTTERNKLKLSAVRTAIHGSTKRRVATAYHFIDIFHLSISGMKSIFNFFIIVGKNFL